MARGIRESDTIATGLELYIDEEVWRLKRQLTLKIEEHHYFQRLTELALDARQKDNKILLETLVEAKLQNISIVPIIESYAKKFIYPHRVNPVATITAKRKRQKE